VSPFAGNRYVLAELFKPVNGYGGESLIGSAGFGHSIYLTYIKANYNIKYLFMGMLRVTFAALVQPVFTALDVA
jgi:hypothetical protein